MATSSVAVLFDREAVGKALAEARRHCAHDVGWTNAINRAALNLEACQWQFDGNTLIIRSATRSNVHYTVNGEGCECKAFQAGRACWHRAARRILVKAACIAQIPAPRNSCPACGALIEGVPYMVNNQGYVYFEICSGDGVHLTKVIMPAQEQEVHDA